MRCPHLTPPPRPHAHTAPQVRRSPLHNQAPFSQTSGQGKPSLPVSTACVTMPENASMASRPFSSSLSCISGSFAPPIWSGSNPKSPGWRPEPSGVEDREVADALGDGDPDADLRHRAHVHRHVVRVDRRDLVHLAGQTES